MEYGMTRECHEFASVDGFLQLIIKGKPKIGGCSSFICRSGGVDLKDSYLHCT